MLSPFARVAASALALFWTGSALAAATATASSPDGSISVKVETDNDGRAMYSVTRKGKVLIAPSRLGFLLTDSEAMVRGFAVAGLETAKADETWQQPWGERTNIRNHYNELLVRLVQPSGLKRAMNAQAAQSDDDEDCGGSDRVQSRHAGDRVVGDGTGMEPRGISVQQDADQRGVSGADTVYDEARRRNAPEFPRSGVGRLFWHVDQADRGAVVPGTAFTIGNGAESRARDAVFDAVADHSHHGFCICIV
jgi:hypothetical protein